MVYTMMRRCIEDPLDWLWQFSNALRMQRRLEQLHEHLGEKHDERIEPKQDQWQMKHNWPEPVQWAKPISDGDIEVW